MVTSSVVYMYPLSNYTFGSKERKMEKDTSVLDRLARMKVKLSAQHLDGEVIVPYMTCLDKSPEDALLIEPGKMLCAKFGALVDKQLITVNCYMKQGVRRSVEGILLNIFGNQNFEFLFNHPHVVLFRKLYGEHVRPGENEIEGLKRKLHSKLGATSSPSFQPNWQIGECVGTWWRPNFETFMYPYCPPHITKPKECKKIAELATYNGCRTTDLFYL